MLFLLFTTLCNLLLSFLVCFLNCDLLIGVFSLVFLRMLGQRIIIIIIIIIIKLKWVVV